MSDRRHAAATRWAAILAGAGLLLTSVGATSTSAAVPTDIFFSEYIEGATGFNKAFEVFNGTGTPVDLDGYTVEMYVNGATTVSDTIVLSGFIPTGAALVVAHPSADPGITAHANLLNNQLTFNGNDALVLKHAGTVIDSFGQVGSNPLLGWGTDPANSVDSDLRRKATITAGDTNPSDAFDPAAEWDGFADTAWDGLGTHAIDTGGGGGGGGGGGSDSGTVAADVTLQAETACIELSTTSISFGTLGFAVEAAPATPDVTITSCSTVEIQVNASATDATGTDATWTLVNDGSTCGGSPDLGTDQYRLGIGGPAFADGPVALDKLETSVAGLEPEASATHTALIWMPCPGSSGDGQTLSFSINYTAIVED